MQAEWLGTWHSGNDQCSNGNNAKCDQMDHFQSPEFA